MDDTTGYGPETITLTLNANEAGNYNYKVYDYTNRYTSSSYELSLSGASVKIYKGDSLIKTYSVPINIKGTIWDVFELDYGVVKSINSIS